MGKKKVIAVFDIGKTHKKILLFDENLKLVLQKEEKFQTTVDKDAFECDDIELIEKWITSALKELVVGADFDVRGVNFSTYGASLAFLDKEGNRLTPIYNYLKEISPEYQSSLFEQYGGVAEFCRKTASPSLGLLLNSGIQILWLKKEQAELFNEVDSILHFPQYLSYVLTGQVVSESTSIGCHTFLWDFDNNSYHEWLKDEGIGLPEPLPNSHKINIEIEGQEFVSGIGIHDSSSSLVPYILGSEGEFLLVSTGTWCINMNPFNHSPLTANQLEKDCLSFLSIDQNPVKSSRLFMGHIHDVNTHRLTSFFNVAEESFKCIKTNEKLIASYLKGDSRKREFFKDAIPVNYIDEAIDLSQFANFSEAYHRLMYDLTLLNSESIDLISSKGDSVDQIYVSGGFARNEIFVRLLANFYPEKKVFTSEVDNSSAMGAALVIWDSLSKEKPKINLGLKEWKPFSS